MSEATKVAMVFPGQGAQRPRMIDSLPPIEDLDRLIDAAEALTTLPLRQLDMLGSAEDVTDTRVAQPMLYLADWSWATALIDAGLRPHMVAGHSLGEYAALAVAGVFSVEAGLELVARRSQAMASVAVAGGGAMAAVLGMERDDVLDLVEHIDHVWVANDNAPGQVVISGTPDGIERATSELTAAGARRVVGLDVSGAFHSPLMRPAREDFDETLHSAAFRDADIDVVSNTEPVPTRDAAALEARLAEQMTSPVRWTETMYALRDAGCCLLVEAGPGSVLRGLARRVEGLEAVSVDDVGIDGVMEEVASWRA